MSCSSCASVAGRCMCSSCGWTDLMFISRRSVFKELQQRRPKCIFEHDKLRFMASLPSSRLDACPRPLPRALHAQYPPPPRHSPISLLLSAFVFFCSLPPLLLQLFGYTPHNTVPRHTTKTIFSASLLMHSCSRCHSENFLRYTQSCVSSGVLPSPTPGCFKAVSNVARWSISWPRDICKQRACLLMLSCVSPRKHSSRMMQTTVTQKPSRGSCRTPMFHVLRLCKTRSKLLNTKGVSRTQGPVWQLDVGASVGSAGRPTAGW